MSGRCDGNKVDARWVCHGRRLGRRWHRHVVHLRCYTHVLTWMGLWPRRRHTEGQSAAHHFHGMRDKNMLVLDVYYFVLCFLGMVD